MKLFRWIDCILFLYYLRFNFYTFYYVHYCIYVLFSMTTIPKVICLTDEKSIFPYRFCDNLKISLGWWNWCPKFTIWRSFRIVSRSKTRPRILWIFFETSGKEREQLLCKTFLGFKLMQENSLITQIWIRKFCISFFQSFELPIKEPALIKNRYIFFN